MTEYCAESRDAEEWKDIRMKWIREMRNRGLLVILALLVLMGSLFWRDTAMAVRAEAERAFSIEAEMMPSDRETYNIKLTIENLGTDWEGTVRVFVDESYRVSTAYDTVLTLPQGSRKQFVTKVPVNSIDDTNGTVRVILLDNKSKEVAKKEFNRLLAGEMTALNMGILSDSYSSLTYLDMGGDKIYFYNDIYPIRLIELRQDNLVELVDTLTFLVIDQYHTDVLTEEEREAIALWVDNGGVLVVGTGAYAEDTLSGLDINSMGMHLGEVYGPGEIENFNASQYLNWSALTLAELSGSFFADYYTAGWYQSEGNGSVGIVPYSFTELGSADSFYEDYAREDFVHQIFENASSNASSRYSNQGYYESSSYQIQRMLSALGNSNSVLNFGVLKWIVILYVIFVGPILYLILRFLKKREMYWFAVPVTALLGIILVFLAGRGFEVVSAKVYSVTLRNLSEDENDRSYLYCYDAGHREWRLRMSGEIDYAGPMRLSYRYSDSDDGTNYYYHIGREDDMFSIGIKPSSSFEDSYFLVGKTGGKEEGRLFAQNIKRDFTGISGNIVNETNRDMPYFAVICNGALYVYENLPAGSTFTLQGATTLYESTQTYYNDYIYNLLSDTYEAREYGKVSALSALGVGICEVNSANMNNEVIVVGLVEDWTKMVDDDCSEISYGCLYSVQ